MPMSHGARGRFVIAGSAVAFLGYVLPQVYGVIYRPGPDSPFADVKVYDLPSFKSSGGINLGNGVVYNGFGGPLSLDASWVGLLLLFAVGVVGWLWNIDHAVRAARIVHQGFGVAGILLPVLNFIWSFRFRQTPPAVVDAFVHDLGGGPAAQQAATNLGGMLGVGALILLFGLLIGCIGLKPKVGASLAGAFVLIILISVLVS